MIKALVVSDSHNNQQLLRQAMEQQKDCDYIFHLGDYYSDLDGNEDLTEGKNIIRVPGIMNPGYFSGYYPAVQVTRLLNWEIGSVHSYQDIGRFKHELDILLFGHTHTPTITQRADRIEINPGHLKDYRDRGNEASYAVLLIEEIKIIIQIIDYKCNLKESYTLTKRK